MAKRLNIALARPLLIRMIAAQLEFGKLDSVERSGYYLHNPNRGRTHVVRTKPWVSSVGALFGKAAL
jgi:hypothetical protein